LYSKVPGRYHIATDDYGILTHGHQILYSMATGRYQKDTEGVVDR
jgi:hypothetical protein